MDHTWTRTEQAAGYLWGTVGQLILRLSNQEKAQIEEIRLRINRPLSVYLKGAVKYVTDEGLLSDDPAKGYVITKDQLNESFRKLCGYAVHSHEEEISQGFVAMPGGHRAGLAGTAFVRANGTYGLRDITSISIRVARQIWGCADFLYSLFDSTNNGGLLVVGAPGSGKTTVLRDIARHLSCTGNKIAVIDERGELSGISCQSIENDLGPNCDVICGANKSRAMLMAVRSLSPQYIICDELGSKDEIEAVCSSLCSGVTTVTSIHAASFDELQRKPQFTALAACGAFRWVVLLTKPGGQAIVREVGELCFD